MFNKVILNTHFQIRFNVLSLSVYSLHLLFMCVFVCVCVCVCVNTSVNVYAS